MSSEVKADALAMLAAAQSKKERYIDHLTSTDMNDALIAFNSRWSLDGDYLRCTECKRPQIASKADQAFVHQADCTKPHADHTHPWHDLRHLLRGLPEQPRQSEGGQDE